MGDLSRSDRPCAVSAPEGHLHVRMSGYRCGFRGAFPPNACVKEVLERARHHSPDYKGFKGTPLEKAEPLDTAKTLAELSVDGREISLAVLAKEWRAPRDEWQVKLS